MKNVEGSNIIPFRSDAESYFRIGIKYADRHIYDMALRYLNKAVKLQPLNPDYQFNLAGILAELKQYKESNRVLRSIIKNIDANLTECYFGIGCNYFDMGNIKLAISYFGKYLAVDPYGYFYEEAENALFYLRLYREELEAEVKENIEDNSQEQRESEITENKVYMLFRKKGDKYFEKKTDISQAAIDNGNITLKWKKECDDIIKCAINNKEHTYRYDYQSKLKEILVSLLRNMEETDDITSGSKEAMAAVLEYIYCEQNSIKTKKSWLAKKYQISPASLTKKLKAVHIESVK